MGYCDADILFWMLADEPVFVQASESRDRRFLSQLATNLVPLEMGSGDWVDDLSADSRSAATKGL